MKENVSTQVCPKCDTVAPQKIGLSNFMSYNSDGSVVDGFAGPEVRMSRCRNEVFSSQKKIY